MNYVGEVRVVPKKFNLYAWLDCAEQLAQCDDLYRAVKLLENLPAYYRDNPPKEIIDFKRFILQKIMTAGDYLVHKTDEDYVERPQNKDFINQIPRGMLIRDRVKELNEQAVTPHLVEMGPGEYWMPIGLKTLGLEFTYHPIGVQEKALEKIKTILGDHISDSGTHPIFVCYETIEHLPFVDEIVTNFMRHCPNAEELFLSTPRYAFMGGNEVWRDEKHLGHVRAYTPTEFLLEARRMFPDYEFGMIADAITVLRGFKVK